MTGCSRKKENLMQSKERALSLKFTALAICGVQVASSVIFFLFSLRFF